jgi:hypothetical protein
MHARKCSKPDFTLLEDAYYWTWWTPHTLLLPWCFERFNYPKYTFTNLCTTTQCPTFTSNKHMKQYLCASSFEIIKATFQPRLWEFGKMVNMYIVSGGPSTYIDLTFCIWPSTLNNFTNAQYVKLGSLPLCSLSKHLEHTQKSRYI